MCKVNLRRIDVLLEFTGVAVLLYDESHAPHAIQEGPFLLGRDCHALVHGIVVFHGILLENSTWVAQGTDYHDYLEHTNSYLIRRLPSRSRTVSLQASCQYLPDSLSASLADLSCSMILSTCLCLACVSGLDFSCALSMMSNTLSICGQVMSGTRGAFLRIRDQ